MNLVCQERFPWKHVSLVCQATSVPRMVSPSHLGFATPASTAEKDPDLPRLGVIPQVTVFFLLPFT